MLSFLNNQIFLSDRSTSFLEKIILFILFAIFLFCLKDGVLLAPDSGGYLEHSFIRIGLYPLIISFFRFLFKDYGLQALVAFQLISILSASYVLVHFLKDTFKLPFFLYLLLVLSFLPPLFIVKIGNMILSEGIAYSLFLMNSYFLLKGLFSHQTKYLYAVLGFTFLLTFTRQQYIFFYGISFLCFLYFYFYNPYFKNKGRFFLTFVLSLGSFFLAERTYHYVYHQTFSGTPFLGTQLIIRPLFIANENAQKLFDDPKQKEFIKEATQSLIHQKIIDPNFTKRLPEQFCLFYNTMYHATFSPIWTRIWSKEVLESETGKIFTSYQVLQVIDKQTTLMTFSLLKSNFFAYISSYFQDVIGGFGGLSFSVFIFFYCLLCIGSLWKNISFFPLSFVFASFIHLGNLAIICFFEPPLQRYTFSTQALLLSLIVIMAYKFFQTYKPSKQQNFPCAV